MKHKFAGEQELRATVALLGVADVSIHAVLATIYEPASTEPCFL